MSENNEEKVKFDPEAIAYRLCDYFQERDINPYQALDAIVILTANIVTSISEGSELERHIQALRRYSSKIEKK